MNSIMFSLLFGLALVSNVQAGGSQWSGSVNMQVARHGTSSTCSDQAIQALNENVAEWLQNEFVTLLGSEDAFRLGVVQGADNAGKLSLTASFDCLNCSRVLNKQSIAKVLMVFMQHRKDVWLHETDAAIREGCVGDHTTVSRVRVTDAVETISVDTTAGRRPIATSRSEMYDAVQAGGSQWSGDVNMQIAKHGPSSTCSDQAMKTLNEKVADWLQNEFVTLLGSADAFRLGVVQGTDNNDKLSLTASFDCIDCSLVLSKHTIAKILMVFMKLRKNVWLHETDAAIREGCVGDHTTVSRVTINDSAATPVIRRTITTSRSALFDARNASVSDKCDSPRENSLNLVPYAERPMSCEISS